MTHSWWLRHSCWTESGGSWWAPIGSRVLELRQDGGTWYAETLVPKLNTFGENIGEVLRGSNQRWDSALRDLHAQLRHHDPVAAADLLRLPDPRS